MAPLFRVISILSLPFGASRKSSNVSKRMKISGPWPSHSLHAKWRNPWIFRPPCVFFLATWRQFEVSPTRLRASHACFQAGYKRQTDRDFYAFLASRRCQNLPYCVFVTGGASVDINQWIPENGAVFGSALRRPHADFFQSQNTKGGLPLCWYTGWLGFFQETSIFFCMLLQFKNTSFTKTYNPCKLQH